MPGQNPPLDNSGGRVGNFGNKGRGRASSLGADGPSPGGDNAKCLLTKGLTAVKKLLALSVVCGLALTGCAGSSSTPPKASTPPKPSTPAPAPESKPPESKPPEGKPPEPKPPM